MFSYFCFILPVTDGTAEKTGIAYDAGFFLRVSQFSCVVCFQISRQRFSPECFCGFKIIALKAFDMLVIPLGKPYQRIINVRKVSFLSTANYSMVNMSEKPVTSNISIIDGVT